MRGDWFNAFTAGGFLDFSEEDYLRWAVSVKQKLPFYLKHLPRGSTLLECCAGPGRTAIPLSHTYRVTAFDRDERILSFARKNAERFGGCITFKQADYNEIVEVFGADGFDAASSSGVLNYLPPDEVVGFMNGQLAVAPTVFADAPLGDGVESVDEHGITRYNYTQEQWLGEILDGYPVLGHKVLKPQSKLSENGAQDELLMVLKRRMQ